MQSRQQKIPSRFYNNKRLTDGQASSNLFMKSTLYNKFQHSIGNQCNYLNCRVCIVYINSYVGCARVFVDSHKLTLFLDYYCCELPLLLRIYLYIYIQVAYHRCGTVQYDFNVDALVYRILNHWGIEKLE